MAPRFTVTRNRVISALNWWNPIGRTVPAPVSPYANLNSSDAQTSRHPESYTWAEWPASFIADAQRARFGSSGNGSDVKRSVTNAQTARYGAVATKAGRLEARRLARRSGDAPDACSGLVSVTRRR